MRWEDYKLYKKIRGLDEFGQEKEEWEFIQYIKLVVSSKCYSTVGNNVVYRTFRPTAITSFKTFEEAELYRVENLFHTYEVESFNNQGRYGQLLLKEVF